MSTDPGEDSATVRTSERYRSRARTLAGLVATGAGAIAAGLVFAPRSIALPVSAMWFGVASMLLMLAATVFFGWAVTVNKKPKGPETQEDAAKRVTPAIRNRTMTGSAIAIAALIALGVLVVLTLALPAPMENARIRLADDALALAQETCPALTAEFSGQLRAGSVNGSEEILPVLIDRKNCSGALEAGVIWIFVARTHLSVTNE